MGVQYRCQNEKRRELVLDHPTLNGIDFLEVLDQEASSDIPRQQTLLVHLLKPVPSGFTRDNVQITGGVRITPVQVLWAIPAIALTTPPVSAAEQTFLGTYLGTSAAAVLIVRTDSSGDYSTYRLSLRAAAAAAEPPPDFDRQLFALDFSFKVECSSEFDCEELPVCPPEQILEPQIDYLAKDYSSFRRLMLDRLRIVMPDWEERNPADLGMALVETVAYAADHLSYYQDAVATESYLGTARQRVSVRRHARLLDYPMHEGCNARAWVTLEVDAAADDHLLSALKPLELQVEAAAVFLTQIDLQLGALPFSRLDSALQAGAQVFEALHDLALYQSHNRLHFYTWGDERCCLPKGASRATLKDDPANRLRLRAGDLLIFEEQASPATGLEADRNVARRQAVRLIRVQPEAGLTADRKRVVPTSLLTDALTGQAYVEIEWHPDDALRFPLCLSDVIDNAVVADLSVGCGNVVLVDAGQTIREDLLPLPKIGRYTPALQEPDIAYAAPYEEAKAKQQAAVNALTQNPQKALPAAFLEGDGERWTARRDLLNSGRFAADFVVEREEDGRALLRFGKNGLGRAAVEGLRATYRVGNGTAGNVGAEAIAHLVTNKAGIRHVRNPLPATGGTAPESLDQVRLYAPQAFRTQQRAVTEADYAAIAQRHPAVQKAAATLRWTGSWHSMFVTVDRLGGLAVDADV